MTVTLGDTLNLVASLVLVLGIAQIIRSLGMIRATMQMLIAASHLRQHGLTEFRFDLGEQPKSGGGE